MYLKWFGRSRGEWKMHSTIVIYLICFWSMHSLRSGSSTKFSMKKISRTELSHSTRLPDWKLADVNLGIFHGFQLVQIINWIPIIDIWYAQLRTHNNHSDKHVKNWFYHSFIICDAFTFSRVLTWKKVQTFSNQHCFTLRQNTSDSVHVNAMNICDKNKTQISLLWRIVSHRIASYPFNIIFIDVGVHVVCGKQFFRKLPMPGGRLPITYRRYIHVIAIYMYERWTLKCCR